MRKAITNENPDLVSENRKYVMRITVDNDEGKAELDNFIDPENRDPVVVTTSRLINRLYYASSFNRNSRRHTVKININMSTICRGKF